MTPALPAPVPLHALLAGRIAPFRAGEPSAIAKRPIEGPVAITALGLAGDEQADPVHHGGPDKALHHYPLDHYPHWRALLGDHPDLAAPGGFGENLSTTGLTEAEVCLGDRFRLGTALIEVSHGRQPCWKLAHRFARPALVAEVVASGRAGWYYRVVEAGTAQAGDTLALVERPCPEWSVARLFTLLIAGGHKATGEGGQAAALRTLAAHPLLAEAWRARARELLAG